VKLKLKCVTGEQVTDKTLTGSLKQGNNMHGKLHAPATFFCERALDRRLVVTQSRSGRFGKEKNFWYLPGIEPKFLAI
jgi:hypothetical protein